jgi:hypothetical protein
MPFWVKVDQSQHFLFQKLENSTKIWNKKFEILKLTETMIGAKFKGYVPYIKR